MDTSADDLFYNRLDTANGDTLLMSNSPVDATVYSNNSTSTFTEGTNYAAITKALMARYILLPVMQRIRTLLSVLWGAARNQRGQKPAQVRWIMRMTRALWCRYRAATSSRH